MYEKQDWYFTFGAGQEYDGYYVVIKNTDYSTARVKMVKKYGIAWSGQYTHDSFVKNGLDKRMERMK